MKKSSIGWTKRKWPDGARAKAKDLQTEKKFSVWICWDWTLQQYNESFSKLYQVQSQNDVPKKDGDDRFHVSNELFEKFVNWKDL